MTESVGDCTYVKFPVTFSEFAKQSSLEPPRLGQHTQEILDGLGYSSDEIQELRAKKVI